MEHPRAESGGLSALAGEIAACRTCPRLVAWRESVADAPRSAHAGETYWSRPLPGFGDANAALVLVGLAPAAHGGNRTGRMFTGDRSGDFLFGALHRAGYANQEASRDLEDGLVLHGAFITAAVRCAPPDNKPTPTERSACAAYLERELALLPRTRVLLALGAFALDACWRLSAVSGPPASRPRLPRFAHGLEIAIPPGPSGAQRTLLCSYHPSQRNVFTGRLDAAGLDAVLRRARELGA